MSRQRLYFVNRFFWPDTSATSQILTDLCRDLDKSHLDVHVLTSRLNYADPSIQYPAEESLDGVTVHRLWSTRFGRRSLPGRALDYLTIYASIFVYLLRHLNGSDIAVFKTDPPLLSVPGAVARLHCGYRMIAWCQDVFPEIAADGQRLSPLSGFFYRLLVRMRDWSLRQSERVIVLGSDMEAFLAGHGISREVQVRIPNWSVQDDASPVEPTDLRRQWQIEPDSFVVGYSGNLGRAHDWQTLLAAARELADDDHIRFLCTGGGHGYGKLREAVEAEGLQGRFRFLPYQPREHLAASLQVPDVHWFSLKPHLTPFIFPSKFFGILQAGRPVIFIGLPESEIAATIREQSIGAVVPEGDVRGMAGAIRELRADASALREAGARARAYWEAHCSKEREINKWNRMLDNLRSREGERPV